MWSWSRSCTATAAYPLRTAFAARGDITTTQFFLRCSRGAGFGDNRCEIHVTPRIQVPDDAIAAFCRRWKVVEFAFFGSVLRDDFGPASDVDVLVAFAPGAAHTLFDLVRMEDELQAMFGRKVDLVTRRAIERGASAWHRDAILGSLAHVALAS